MVLWVGVVEVRFWRRGGRLFWSLGGGVLGFRAFGGLVGAGLPPFPVYRGLESHCASGVSTHACSCDLDVEPLLCLCELARDLMVAVLGFSTRHPEPP